jgi:hypothetical protein
MNSILPFLVWLNERVWTGRREASLMNTGAGVAEK